MELGLERADVQAVLLRAANGGLKLGNVSGSSWVGGIGVSVGCGWASGRGRSGSIVKGLIVSSHFNFPCPVVALDVNFFTEGVHHPKAVPEPRRWRAAAVTSGIALGRDQPGLYQLVVALGVRLRARAEARVWLALALSGGTTVAPSTRAKPRLWGKLPGAGGEERWGCVAGVGG